MPLVIPSKRKALESVDSPKKKRQKKKTRPTSTDIRRPRYFEAELADVQGFDDELISETPGPEPLAPTSRPYSPSQPILEFDHIDYNSVSSLEAQHCALFIPILDSNTFRLSRTDLEPLRLPSHAAECSDTVLILLTPGKSLSFVGTASITLLRGTIMILGTPITPSRHAHRVFSPRSSPFVSLEALDSPGDAVSFQSGNLPQRVQSELQESDSVVLIQKLRTAVEGLEIICRTFDGIFEVDVELRRGEPDKHLRLNGVHLINYHPSSHPQLQPFYLPKSWGEALDAVVPSLASYNEGSLTSTNPSSFIGLVRGPKKSGKSSFARTLLNRLTTRFSRVAFLECDIGQSEFTPGGMVSLHVISSPVFGPPFTHLRFPYRAHYIGHVTPRSSPAHYLFCIQSLVQTYHMDLQFSYQQTHTGSLPADEDEIDRRIDAFVPLVVNTQGWMKGLGSDLLRKIEDILRPTHIFDFDAQTNVFPRRGLEPTPLITHALQPIPTSPLAAYYTATDHRSLILLSYFYGSFSAKQGSSEILWWKTDVPLCATPPWEINCRKAIDQIVLVGAGYEDVVPQELDRAINCGIVALVCDEDSEPPFNSERQNDSSFPYRQGAPAPDPSTSHCIGLAFIRGINSNMQQLHVLTPLPQAALEQCRILVKGELEMPVWGMLDFRGGQGDIAGVPWEKVPYLLKTGQGARGAALGAGKRKVRRNLMRRAQL